MIPLNITDDRLLLIARGRVSATKAEARAMAVELVRRRGQRCGAEHYAQGHKVNVKCEHQRGHMGEHYATVGSGWCVWSEDDEP